MWQTDFTYWQLADGQPAEILNLIDDHSRLFLGSDAYHRVKAASRGQLPQGSAAARPPLLAALRQRRRLHRLSPQGQGAPGIRARAARRALQELTPLPPPDLRKDRATPPDTQALPLQATTASHALRTPRPSSTPSPTTTTTSGHTEPSAAKARCRPTAPASRPDPQATPPTPTSGSARTRSTRPAKSASATKAGSTKSQSEEPTKANQSSS